MSPLSGITPHLPLLLGVAVALILTAIGLRVKRDGFRAVFFESAEQRWKRHEQMRMEQWARRDHQRQRFARDPARAERGTGQAAMLNRANNPPDDRRPARNRRTGNLRPPAPADANVPPDIADPFMSRQDWIAYLTTE